MQEEKGNVGDKAFLIDRNRGGGALSRRRQSQFTMGRGGWSSQSLSSPMETERIAEKSIKCKWLVVFVIVVAVVTEK